MKNYNIKSGTIAREAGYLAGCFAVALGANIFAIIKFHRPFTEIFSQIGFVAAITVVLYIYICVLRGIAALLKLGYHKLKSYTK